MEKLLSTVIQLKASDLHITVGQPPVVRHQGRMRKLDTKSLDQDDTTALMKSITPDRCQQELQEKGGADFAIEYTDGYRFRVAVFKQRGNIGMVLRRIPSVFLSFEQVGMPEAIKRLITRPRGLLLVTGPTGSGKTTSLASMINWINENYDRHIITMEDPIEYYHPHKKSIVVQREIGVDCPNFSEALRRALRQDPDVMLVGEMRDLATISSAITAAETGHLVFGTLHTSGAASTINRVVDAFPTDQQAQVKVQLANNLIAVLSQALCPRVDTDGMVAAYEFMYVTPGVQNLIREDKSFRIDSEIQTGKKYGMQLLDDNLWMNFQAGKISAEEAIDKSKNPGGMVDRMNRAGIGAATDDEALLAEADEMGGGGGDDTAGGANGAKLKPNNGGGGGSASNEAERQAQIAANRARMAAMAAKK